MAHQSIQPPLMKDRGSVSSRVISATVGGWESWITTPDCLITIHCNQARRVTAMALQWAIMNTEHLSNDANEFRDLTVPTF